MVVYGLLGKSLGHSYSPDIFKEKIAKKGLNGEYRLFEMENIDNLKELIETIPDLKGLNVTIPYKNAVVPCLNELDPVARITGSVNMIKIKRTKSSVYLKGYNTDAYAFEKTIKPLINNKQHLRALILGTGGVAHTVAYVFRRLGIYFYFVSRKPVKVESLRYSWLDEGILRFSKLIINATPIGMYPDENKCPEIPYELLTPQHILYDMVYNPDETLFLKKGKEQGAITKNGLEMLYLQADRAWKIWQ